MRFTMVFVSKLDPPRWQPSGHDIAQLNHDHIVMGHIVMGVEYKTRLCTPSGQNQFSLRHPSQLTMQFWDVKHHILTPSWSTPQNYLDVRTRVSNQKVSGLVWVQISTYFLVQFRFSSGTKIVRTSSYRFVTVCN